MRLRLATLLIAVLPLGLVIISACGGGDGSLTLEEYLRRFDALGEDFLNDGDRLVEDVRQAEEDAETQEEEADILRNFWARVSDRYEEAIADMGGLEPPPEAREAHSEWLAVQREATDFVGGLNDRAQRATSLDEIAELNSEFDGPIATDLSERGDAACLGLQDIADDNGIDVDLECLE